MPRQHWPDWTPKDELILAEQEVIRLEKLVNKEGGWVSKELLAELTQAYNEFDKWKEIVNGK